MLNERPRNIKAQQGGATNEEFKGRKEVSSVIWLYSGIATDRCGDIHCRNDQVKGKLSEVLRESLGTVRALCLLCR